MDFTDIEDNILAELKSSINYLKTVETAETDIISRIEKMSIKFPAALVLYSGSQFSLVDSTVQNEKPSFTIFCADRSLRGRGKARKGASSSKERGVYQVIVDVLETLTNQDFGLVDTFRLSPVRVEPVLMTDRLAMYGVEFGNSFDKDYGLPT